MKGEGYVSKTPASGRPSLTAAIALCQAYLEDRLQDVADTWQTIAALPHAVVIHTPTSQAFLVLMSAKYAMRTWPANVVSVPHVDEGRDVGSERGDSGVVDLAYRFRRWVFDMSAVWEWMSVWNVEECSYQPKQRCTSTSIW